MNIEINEAVMFTKLAVAALALANASNPTSIGAVNAVAPNILAESCGGKNGWEDPAPPVHVHGDTYYVGSCGISSLHIVSPAGHILIDGGTENFVFNDAATTE